MLRQVADMLKKILLFVKVILLKTEFVFCLYVEILSMSPYLSILDVGSN